MFLIFLILFLNKYTFQAETNILSLVLSFFFYGPFLWVLFSSVKNNVLELILIYLSAVLQIQVNVVILLYYFHKHFSFFCLVSSVILLQFYFLAFKHIFCNLTPIKYTYPYIHCICILHKKKIFVYNWYNFI